MFENIPKNWEKVALENLLEYEQPTNYIVASEEYNDSYPTPVLTAGKSFILGYTNETEGIYQNTPVIIFDDFTTESKFVDFEFKVKSSAMKILKAKDNETLKYLYYLMQILPFNNTQHKRYWISEYSKIKIGIPKDINEVKEIVKVLDATSEIIRLRTACIESAQSLISALFQEMFGDLDCNNSYKKVLFGDIITVLTDYHANGSYEKLKEHVTLLDNPDYALMVRTTDLEKNNFIDNVKYISQSAYEFLEKSKIYGGEIIINKIGSAGNVYLMPKLNRPVSLGMNAFLIRIDEKCANNIFIYNLLTSSYGKKIIQEKVSGAVTKTITKNSIRSLKLYLPPVEQQELFAEKVQEIEAYIKTQHEELENAKAMFQSLLHHSFTGELTRRAYGE